MDALAQDVRARLEMGLSRGDAVPAVSDAGEKYVLVSKEDGPDLKRQGNLLEKTVSTAAAGKVLPTAGHIIKVGDTTVFGCNGSAQEVHFTKGYILTEHDHSALTAAKRPAAAAASVATEG